MTLPEKQSFVSVPDGKIFYRVFGSGNKTPLLCIHGGPGGTHNLLLPLKSLAKKRPVIFYDQLGCGQSSVDPEKSKQPGFWTIDRFFADIEAIKAELRIKEWSIFGTSFGPMLLTDYLLTNPQGVKSIIMASPCLSAPLWKRDADLLRKQLPAHIQAALTKHEERETTDSEEYQNTMMEFYKRFVCRLDPWPQTLLDALGGLNKEIYMRMWGPSEFYPTGSLKDYDRTPALGKITLPTLFTCGRYDEATPETTQYYASLMPNAQLHVFENSAHLAYIEETEEYVKVVGEFLEETD